MTQTREWYSRGDGKPAGISGVIRVSGLVAAGGCVALRDGLLVGWMSVRVAAGIIVQEQVDGPLGGRLVEPARLDHGGYRAR